MNNHEISAYIRKQFPTAYDEGGDNFIAFVEAYYEYLDKNYYQNKTILETVDIDNTLNEFVVHFKKTYLNNFPYVAATSKEFMIKNILDFYKSKGSVMSTQLLIRMLFGEESKVHLPSIDIFKPSDSKWVEPQYIEVSRSDRTVSFLNTEIIGSKSRAKAIVEGVVTKRVEGKYIDIVYLSNVRGSFLRDEFITNDGRLKNAPHVIGSLTLISVNNGGRNNKIGDTFEVIGAGGSKGKVRVSEVVGATGRVDFSIEDGGYGFTTTSDTDVYISDAILMVKNPNLVYRKFDEIRQDMETIELISYDNISSNVNVGNYITGINPNGTVVANGVIANFTNNGDGSGEMKLLIQSGTFLDQKRISISNGNTAPFLINDKIEEDSLLTLEVSSNTIPLVVGQKIEQATEINMQSRTGTLTLTSNANAFEVDEVIRYVDSAGDAVIQGSVLNIVNNTIKLKNIFTYKNPKTFPTGSVVYGTTSNATGTVASFAISPASSIYTDKVSGIITSISGQTLTLNKVWGEFLSSKTASIYNNEMEPRPSGGVMISAVNYIERGASGKVSSKTDNSIVVQDIVGAFDIGRIVRSNSTKAQRTISTIANEGATDVRLNGVLTANAAISNVSNTTASGIVIGQNTSAVGIWGNNHPYISSGDINIPNTSRNIASIIANVNNVATIITTSAHGFVAGDAVNVNIELQQNSEVKTIYGVYTILTTPNTQSFTITVEPNYGEIIRIGDFSFFSATVEKTLFIQAKTISNNGSITSNNLIINGSFESGNVSNWSGTANVILQREGSSISLMQICPKPQAIQFNFGRNLIQTTSSFNALETDDLKISFQMAGAGGQLVNRRATVNVRWIGSNNETVGNAPTQTYTTETTNTWENVVMLFKPPVNAVKGEITFSNNGNNTYWLLTGVEIVLDNGNITNIYGVSTGFDASFKIGSLEGEETVFINTDIVGGNNIVDVPYLNIRVDAGDSGIGYVGAVKVDSGGTEYSNGAVISFSGGGYGNGEPEIVASGYITTSANGVIVDVIMTDVGQGYHQSPTLTLPTTTGTTANLSPLMEYGYGFPKMPEGGIENYLEDLWTSKEMTIGKISSLSEINPGSNYNTNPFVLVYNQYIAGFQRTERIVIMVDGTSAPYMIGETVYQIIPGDGGSILSPKGYVSGIQGNMVYLKRLSFNTSFTKGFPMIGQTSGISRYVTGVEELSGGLVLGDNAVIPSVAIAANGIATKLEVIDSGFGYIDNQPVTLFNEDKPFIMTGVTNVKKHGKSEGSWDSTSSHLDGNSMIHDNDYYQEFSYEIVTGSSIERYKDILSNIIHVAGTKLFGKVEKRNYIDISVKSRNSVVGNWSNFSNAYTRLLQSLFSNGENGDILWPDIQNWYSDIYGTVNITGPGEPVLAWRGSNKITNVKKKNIITWSDDFTGEDWELNGISYNRNTSIVTVNTTNSQHYIKKSIITSKKGPYVLSVYIGNTTHERVTIGFDGEINGGYVTFNLSNNTIVETSGGYSGKIFVEGNGTKRIAIYNNSTITKTNASINMYMFFNSNAGSWKETYNPTSQSILTINNFQLEVGTDVTPYQDVTHGDEWDGIRYIQGKGKDFSLISAKMPINGIKNLFENSDEPRSSTWIKRNCDVITGETMNGEFGHRWYDTYDKNESKEHSLLVQIPNKKLDNFGFILKPNETCRYVAISFASLYAVFDLNMGTNIVNTFDGYTVHVLDDGSVVIGVYLDENTVKYTSELTTDKIKLSMLTSSSYSSKEYVGDGNRYLGILRAYMGYTGLNADYTIGLQKNRNRYDISEKDVESIWYLYKENDYQKYVGRIYGNEPSYSAIAGTNGIIFEEIDPAGNIYYYPNYADFYNYIGGIISIITIDRPFTNAEKELIVEYFQKGGAGSVIERGISSNGMNGFTNNSILNFNYNNGEVVITQDNKSGIIKREIENGLYKIEFEYTLSSGIRNFDIVDMDNVVSYRSDVIKSVPMSMSQGNINIVHDFNNGYIAFKISGYSGSELHITNFSLTKYENI